MHQSWQTRIGTFACRSIQQHIQSKQKSQSLPRSTYRLKTMMTKRKYFGTKKKSDLTELQTNSLSDYKARFKFWHNRQIDLLTFSINLLFTLSVAVGGFIISNYDKALFANKNFCGQYSLSRTTLLILTLSATIGVLGLVARVNDFRFTKDTVKTRRRIFELENDIRYEDYEPSDTDYQKAKRDNLIWWTRLLGRITWICFYIQLTLFMIVIWTLTVGI
jgi:hypothetical protein